MLAEGNADQKARVKEAAQQMKEWRDQFPGSTWEPLDDIELPDGLKRRAKNVAKTRLDRAARYRLKNKHGAVRKLEDEIRVVEGELAGLLMVGGSLDVIDQNAQRTKSVGNLGDNRSAFIPKAGNWQLVIRPEQPDSRRVVLIQIEGQRFRCLGWTYAGEAKTPEFEKTYERGGVTGSYYLVPTHFLRPLAELVS